MAYLGLGLSAALACIAFTPAGLFLLRYYMGVSEAISLRSITVLKCMSVLPMLTVLREYCWGLLIGRRRTKHVVIGKAVSLAALAATVAAVGLLRPANAALIGAIGMLSSQTVEAAFLLAAVKAGKRAAR
jgi:hypothetical protein